VGVALTPSEIADNFDRIKADNAERDSRMEEVLLVRQGRMRDVYPDLFPDGPFSDPIVANMVDISARDLSEVIAPLPAFNCNSPTMVSEKERKKADKREEIVNGIVDFSDLSTQMFTAADRYVTALCLHRLKWTWTTTCHASASSMLMARTQSLTDSTESRLSIRESTRPRKS
jgi:hypothetical protein